MPVPDSPPAPSRRAAWIRRAVRVLVGTGAGLALYFFVGCRTDACGLISTPWGASLAGAALGALWTPEQGGK